jgi:[NiFe] hydrogenase assembly HybE family chaperone
MPGADDAATLTAPGAEASTARRARALATLFRHVAATRMAGIPILHPKLEVQAVGFAPEPDGHACVGVLLTPWFMNLVRLPLAGDEAMAPIGVSARRRVGGEVFDFIGADEAGFGRYESCSLFSPMGDFADHAAALATAQAVLDELRRPPEPVAAVPAGPAASRRSLLFGRPAGSRGAR